MGYGIQKEWSAGIGRVNVYNEKTGKGELSPEWRILDVHEGDAGSAESGGGECDVHIHPWAKGDKVIRRDGLIGTSQDPFKASTPNNNYNGDKDGGDTGGGKQNNHIRYIGTPNGIGAWYPTQDILDGSLKFIAPSPNQMQELYDMLNQLNRITSTPGGFLQ